MTCLRLVLLAVVSVSSSLQANAFQSLAPVRRNVGTLHGFLRLATTRLQNIPILEEWKVLSNGRIEGKVINHAEIEEGWIISTSPLKNPDRIDGEHANNEGIYIETLSGSQYLLRGRGNSEYNIEMVNKAADKIPPFYYQMPSSEMELAPYADAAVFDNSADLINLDKKQAEEKEEGMSEAKKLMQQVKDAGIAGVISYALWEFGFWAVSVPVCVFAYEQVTGHWPDFASQEDLKQLGAEAFAFVNLARFAVPLRIGLALSTTPWIQRNIVDRFQGK